MLLGVLERPTVRWVVWLGVFIAAAVLNRSPTGWACVIAAFIVAAWFASGRGGPLRGSACATSSIRRRPPRPAW